MKRLSEEKTKVLFEKLSKYVGSNVRLLVDRPDGSYCFREQKDRVYYVSEKLLKLAITFPPEQLLCAGTCIGKFTKTGKFRIHITALQHLAPLAQHRLWLKAGAEQQFLYGNHVTKAGLGRISESCTRHCGVLVCSMADMPIGFGIAARSAVECKSCDPLSVVCFHQADVGEYVRSEDTLV